MQIVEKYDPQRASLARRIAVELTLVRKEIRQGRFRRTMAAMTTFAAITSGFEAYIQHRRDDFSESLMWTPVLLMPPVMAAAIASLFYKRAVKSFLPVSSAAALVDGVIGFYSHLHGISKLPGGFKRAQYNVVMGPPVFAPLLVSIVGVMGLMASWLRPERLEDLELPGPKPKNPAKKLFRQAQKMVEKASLRATRLVSGPSLSEPSLPAAVAHGRFQKGMALVTAIFAGLAGGEAYFEHMRGSYNQRWMWTPVWVTPPMLAAAVGAVKSETIARKVLPVAAFVTMVEGMIGFYLHIRGLRRMPGGFNNLRFNITLGPPLFAPLLFSAVGVLGLIASILGRRK